MALEIDKLANELVDIFKTEVEKTNYDAITGKKTTVAETVYPEKKKMKLLAEALINHIQKNSEIKGVESNVTVTTVNATVAPGIPTTTGATVGPGTATGTGSGNSQQSNLVRVK